MDSCSQPGSSHRRGLLAGRQSGFAPLTPLPTLESLLGKLLSLEKLVPYGRLHFRRFQLSVLLELRLGRFFRLVRLPDDARADLRWWCDARRLQSWTPVCLPKPDLVIHTDASILGWGACFNGQTVRGTWSPKETSFHINVRALRHFAVRFKVGLCCSASITCQLSTT